MSVIIRLQNLPWSANALDIRQYFQGMSIPEGGVHIVGGEQGDAFIAFSTDEDARQAMLIDGGKIKEVKIKLFLSSRSEMQKVIETARAQSLNMQSFMQMPPSHITTNTMPATQIPPTPAQTTPALPTINQLPVKTTSDVKQPPSLPIGTPTSELVKAEVEPEKKDHDTESVSSKDAKRSHRGRSKSRDKSKSRSRSRSRDRNYRSKDRYRDRRRRDRSRSRDRRDRRRYRDRSRSRDRSSRKSSRDRKRDTDRIDRNSSEINIVKNATVPEKNLELPTPKVPPSKLGFSNSGWVAANAPEKPSNTLTNPIEFSIGKSAINPSVINEPPLRKPEESTPVQIPLPHQVLTSQPTSIAHNMVLPQPPPFPQLPIEVPKDEDGRMRTMPFPPNQPNAITTQHSSVYVSNQPQLLQTEANTLIHHPSQAGPMMMPPGWNPNMFPLMNNPHMLLGPTIGVNPSDKTAMPPMMNVPAGMYIRPPVFPPNEKIQSPHLNSDPRMQPGFNMQQPRIDGGENISSPLVNFGSQKQTNYVDGKPNSANHCVEIRNMSMNTTNSDIHIFFQGLQISQNGVKIIADKKGNKVGMAYVRFTKPIFKDMAMSKNGKMLKNSVVEILHIEDNIFDKATDCSDNQGNLKDNQNYQQPYNNFVALKEPDEIFTDLVIHDVPPYCKDQDIHNLFKGFSIEDAFVLLRTGRKTATGYIRFQSPSEARRAFVTNSRLSIGYTSVKAAICYEHEFADARDRKNMEEEDEDMMDPKDAGYAAYENRGHHNSKKYSSYDSEQDGSNYQNERRSQSHKTLLPTPPNIKPYDTRANHSNQNNKSNNFNSRYDRRQQDHPSRSMREDYSKKPNLREDFHQKPYPRESRFQTRQPPRDDFIENRRSLGEKKFHPHNAFEKDMKEQYKKIDESPKYPLAAPPTVSLNKSNTGDNVKREADVIESVEIKSEIEPDNESKPDTKLLNISDSQVKQEGNQEQDNSQIMKKDTAINHINSDCLILKGLPFNANDRDILDFFSDEGLAPHQIHIMLDMQGQPAGDAFCVFNTVEEVSRALTKHQSLMGRSVVSVQPVRREEMMDALKGVVQLREHYIHSEFQENFQPMDFHGPHPRFPPRGRGYPQFPPRGRGRGGFRMRHRPPLEMDSESQNVNSFGKPGCVVALENVPFRAEVEDILKFFGRFSVSRDNVIRRFDENGKATGDARVCFNSPEEANHAIRTLNLRPIINRQIYLSLV